MKLLHKEDILLDYSLFFSVIPDFSKNYRFALNLTFFTKMTLFHIGMILKFTSDLENAIDAPYNFKIHFDGLKL